MVTVLTETSESQAAVEPGDALWLSRADAHNATGWLMKPEGFCKGDVCVPIPASREAEFVRDDEVNVSALWSLMGNPAAATQKGDVWFLGQGAQTRNDALESLDAPDFTLPDFSGKLHSLTDFRRKRVLLITWASW